MPKLLALSAIIAHTSDRFRQSLFRSVNAAPLRIGGEVVAAGMVGTATLPVADTDTPPELASSENWVGWRYGEQRATGKREKLPINPRTGKKASVGNPETWGSHAQALDAVERYGLEGAGFVHSTDDPFCGIDIDDCRDPKTGQIAPWAQGIIEDIDS